MQSGSISMASTLIVPAPPGVFATSMPLELSSVEHESNLDHSSHPSVMVNGQGLPTSLPSSNCAFTVPNSIKSNFVMLSEDNNNPYKNSNKIRKRNKSSRRSFHPKESNIRHCNGTSSTTTNQCGNLPTGNKPLKVTIRRTAHSHTLGGRGLRNLEQHKNPINNSVTYSSVEGTELTQTSSALVSTSGLQCTKTSLSECLPTPFKTESILSSNVVKLPIHNKAVAALSNGIIKQTAVETDVPSHRDASTSTHSCSTITEPDLFGPCEPGSKVVLEGVVWLETPGMMVINAHWRGKAYLGTLLDASKNTLGPSCPDKMISALSLFRGRQNWSTGSYYRNSTNTASNNRLYSSSNSNCTSRAGNNNGGVAMTTRAAAAAAAAAERTGTDEEVGNCRPSNFTGINRRRGSGLHSYQRGGGARKKRRRGLLINKNSITTSEMEECVSLSSSVFIPTVVDKNSHIPMDLTAVNTLCSSSPSRITNSESRITNQSTMDLNSVVEVDDALHAPLVIPELTPFACPQENCEKRFADILGLRYHLDMGHGRSSDSENSAVHEINNKIEDNTVINTAPTTTHQLSTMNNEQSINVAQQHPPRLAKAKSGSSISLTYADDDQPPPHLDRGPRAEEELVSNDEVTGNDLTEPPAASPAYSDISDDGAASSVIDPIHSLLPVANNSQPLKSQSHSQNSQTNSIFKNGNQLPHNPNKLFAAVALAAAKEKSIFLSNSKHTALDSVCLNKSIKSPIPHNVQHNSPINNLFLRNHIGSPTDFISQPISPGLINFGSKSGLVGSSIDAQTRSDYPHTFPNFNTVSSFNGLSSVGLKYSPTRGGSQHKPISPFSNQSISSIPPGFMSAISQFLPVSQPMGLSVNSNFNDKRTLPDTNKLIDLANPMQCGVPAFGQSSQLNTKQNPPSSPLTNKMSFKPQ